jgi:hypothetical protein
MMLSRLHPQLDRLCGPLYVHLFNLLHVSSFMSNQQFDRLKPVAAAAYDCADGIHVSETPVPYSCPKYRNGRTTAVADLSMFSMA